MKYYLTEETNVLKIELEEDKVSFPLINTRARELSVTQRVRLGSNLNPSLAVYSDDLVIGYVPDCLSNYFDGDETGMVTSLINKNYPTITISYCPC